MEDKEDKEENSITLIPQINLDKVVPTRFSQTEPKCISLDMRNTIGHSCHQLTHYALILR